MQNQRQIRIPRKKFIRKGTSIDIFRQETIFFSEYFPNRKIFSKEFEYVVCFAVRRIFRKIRIDSVGYGQIWARVDHRGLLFNIFKMTRNFSTALDPKRLRLREFGGKFLPFY